KELTRDRSEPGRKCPSTLTLYQEGNDHAREGTMSLRGGLIKRVLYPLNELREGKRTLAHLQSLEESQYEAPARRDETRFRKLRIILNQAFEHTPFYRERFREAGITPADIKDWSDLRKLRPLRKADLQNHLDNLVAKNVPEHARHRSATGGSTGHHTPFYRDNR